MRYGIGLLLEIMAWIWIAFQAYVFVVIPLVGGFGPGVLIEWIVTLAFASIGVGVIWAARRLRGQKKFEDSGLLVTPGPRITSGSTRIEVTVQVDGDEPTYDRFLMAIDRLTERVENHTLCKLADLRLANISQNPMSALFVGEIADPESWHAMVRLAAESEKPQIIAAYLGGEFEKMAGGSPLFGPVGVPVWVRKMTVGEHDFSNPG